MNLRYVEGWAALAAAIVLGATPARAQQFVAAIFISPCQQEIPTFSTATLHIWVCLEGPIVDGVTSGELRVDGLPSGWRTVVRANPAADVVAGDLVASDA